MASIFIKLPPSSGGSGAVDSVFGRTGNVTAQNGDYTASQVTNVPAGNIVATNVQAAIDELDSEKQVAISGSNSKVVYKDDTGVVKSLESVNVNPNFAELSYDNDVDVEAAGGGVVDSHNTDFRPIENSPNTIWTQESVQVNIDPDSSGFTFGTNGTAVNVFASNVVHSGTSDIGSVNLTTQNYSLGNGTDPIDVKGVGYQFGFGSVNNNVTITDWIQGYGFQPAIQTGATMNGYTNAFYDNANYQVPTSAYTSVQLSPQLVEIKNNSNYTGINLNPTIDNFDGNASFNGLAIAGSLGTMDTGTYNGINVSPTVDETKNAYGIYASMDNVTTFVGSPSTLTEQDLTFTFNTNGDNNSITLQYTPGATAGSEVVTVSLPNITVQIEDGVSTATQIKAAVDANFTFSANITTTISGVGSNPQNIFGPTNFAGGVADGTKKAAYFDGDVEITGALTFGGALSVGKFSAFHSQALVNGTGTPSSVHSLITQPTVAANATITGGDMLGVNTAALITLGDNSTTTTTFLGVAALGLPAVLSMGTGSTVDRVGGAVFALSLDATATGGTVDIVELCRAVALPNGVTTVNNMYGFKFDLPFGDVGTDIWGFYSSVASAHNYMYGDLLIGGTPSSDDIVTNANVALEIKSTTKAAVLSRMTTTQRDAMTAIAGMVIFNTTTSKFQGHDGASWVDLN